LDFADAPNETLSCEKQISRKRPDSAQFYFDVATGPDFCFAPNSDFSDAPNLDLFFRPTQFFGPSECSVDAPELDF
jgi:hypothetical protein